MPSKKQYDLVSDDGYDGRIPLHNDEAFQHGIGFPAKYIGTLDVPRPSSRVEIVAAMRRIRYEFKAKAIKKRKVILNVSTEGAKVVLRKKKKKSQWVLDESQLVVMEYPIYRIFYVSHDSQDLKIFSFIARDPVTNVFKCNVFKAYKKSQAMRIVRTIGQAFEVCHKLTMETCNKNNDNNNETTNDNLENKRIDARTGVEMRSGDRGSDEFDVLTDPMSPDSVYDSVQTPDTDLSSPLSQSLIHTSPGVDLNSPRSPHLVSELATSNKSAPLSAHHQLQMVRQQLEQQQQQTQVAVAQVNLLKDQLAAETAARMEAQSRTHQLLIQNRELLDHINTLVSRLHSLETRTGVSTDLIYSISTQIPVLPGPGTPSPGPVLLPGFLGAGHPDHASYENHASLDHAHFENATTKLHTDSPDSGHREMSSDSLSYNFNPSNEQWATQGATLGAALVSQAPPNPPNPPESLEMVKLRTPLVPKLDPPPRVKRESWGRSNTVIGNSTSSASTGTSTCSAGNNGSALFESRSPYIARSPSESATLELNKNLPKTAKVPLPDVTSSWSEMTSWTKAEKTAAKNRLKLDFPKTNGFEDNFITSTDIVTSSETLTSLTSPNNNSVTKKKDSLNEPFADLDFMDETG